MTYTVITCTATQDGNYLVMLSAGKKQAIIARSSPIPFEEGERVKLDRNDRVVKA